MTLFHLMTSLSEIPIKQGPDVSSETVNLLHLQMDRMLHNAIQMTEISMDIKEKCCQGEKYICYLRSIAGRAAKNVRNLQNTSNQFLVLSQKIVTDVIASIENIPNVDNNVCNMKQEYERLLNVIDKELADNDDSESIELEHRNVNVAEKIKYLEAKQQKISEGGTCGVQPSCSVRSVKSDVDEKYPENWSRDSLIDLNNVVNLPPVPEDIFTCFANKPTRTSSLSSLKGMRKVKLFLQRAENNSDDDDSSDMDEHDVIGDNEEKSIPGSKKLLGNIKEETQQD